VYNKFSRTFICDVLINNEISNYFVSSNPKIKKNLISMLKVQGKIKPYCTSVNFRLNPKFVFEVGKVLATNGLFIV